MPWDIKKELGRKLLHLAAFAISISCFWILNNLYNKNIALLGLIFTLLIYLMLEYLRLDLEWRLPFREFCKIEERNDLNTINYLTAAAIICFAVFDFKIALAALTMATIGDFTAVAAGKIFGKTRIPGLKNGKTIEGALGELVVNLFIGSLILSQWYIVIPMAVLATIVETATYVVDDNIAVPLSVGLLGQLLLALGL